MNRLLYSIGIVIFLVLYSTYYSSAYGADDAQISVSIPGLTSQLAAPPSVDFLYPLSGPTTGGTLVTISGAGFTGTTAITFGGIAATSYTVVSDTQIRALSPVGPAGMVDITVTTQGGTSVTSEADRFTYVVPPAVTGVSPSNGTAAGGTSVTITGTNFTGAKYVKFGGVATGSYTVNSDTQITATSPADLLGTVHVTVTTDGGMSVLGESDQFTVNGPPYIMKLLPEQGPASGNTKVIITGSGFTGATSVFFGSAAAASFIVNSDKMITVITPAHVSDGVLVSVTTPAGSNLDYVGYTQNLGPNYVYFSFINGPLVTGIFPSSGPQTGGTPVVITGFNFTGATAVAFGDTAATGFTIDSDTQITALSPSAPSGPVDLTVTTPIALSTVNALSRFTYTLTPTVTGVTPSSGSTAGGTAVTITGANFTGATAVKFGSLHAVSYQIDSDTQITAHSPPAQTGTVEITITTPGGTSAIGVPDHFTYTLVPAVTSVIPSSGLTTGGTSVVIAGANFTGTTAVIFGNTPATSYTIDSDTQITVIVPASSSGTVDITVTSSYGTSTTSNADRFTYCTSNALVTVTELGDSGAGTLRQAVLDVCPGGTIDFGVTGTIPLSSGKIDIAKEMTIAGPGAADLTVQGRDGNFAFAVGEGITNVTIRGITVSSTGIASSNGGGIMNQGGLTISGCVVNNTYYALGNTGNLQLHDSTLASNQVGILNYGQATVSGSTFRGNKMGINATAAWSGAVQVTQVKNSTFIDNDISGFGTNAAGIMNFGGTLTVENSTFNRNIGGAGGAILNMGGIASVINSTFLGNEARVMADEYGNLLASSGTGGAIAVATNNLGFLTVTNCTITGNKAVNGGGIGQASGDSEIFSSMHFAVTNSILSANIGDNCSTASLLGTRNIEDGTTCFGQAPLTTTNPLLDPAGLKNMGGPTQTIALLPGSPAIKAGDTTTCTTASINRLDQRGEARVGTCDIGAFESQGFTLTKTGGDNQSAAVNSSFTLPLALSVTANNAGEPVNGGVITFSAPASEASTNPTSASATITNGAVSKIITANSILGSYSVTAATNGASSVSYSLANILPATTSLTVTISGSGSVTSQNQLATNYTCNSGSCDPVPFNQGDTVTLTATGSNSTFSSWSGDYVSSSNPGSITMTGDKAVTATFNATTATVKIDGSEIPYYSINSALAAPVLDATIKAAATGFTENVTMQNSHTLTLKGGYSDSNFSSQTGYSTINGSLTISSGTLVVDRVVVGP